MTYNNLESYAENFNLQCEALLKNAIIKKLPNKKYRVTSEKGRNLGTYDSKSKAEKRLKQVEYFKYLAKKEKNDVNSTDDKIIDLTKIEDFSYSAIMRQLRKQCNDATVQYFMKLFKKNFDTAYCENVKDPAKHALHRAVHIFHKKYKVKFNEKLVKSAAASELGDPKLVGRYMADIIRFTLKKISPENRPKSILSLKNKIYYLNENEIAEKKMPASSALGQSITFVKHVLFSRQPDYIRKVLNSIVENL